MKLTGLTWENVFLKAAITSSREKASFYLTKNLQPAGAEVRPADSVLLQPDAWEDGVFRFKLNICQMDGRAFLENGGWHLIAETDEGCFPVEADPELAMEFDSLARVFPYAEGKAYTVWFSAEEGPDEKILPVLHSSFVARDDDWKKRLSGMKGAAFGAFSSFFRRWARGKSKKGNLLFLTQTRNEIAGNLAAVDARIKERGLDRFFHVSYYAHEDARGYRLTDIMKLAKLIAAQEWVLVDDFVPIFSYIDPPEDTQVIQLWHAGVGFKAVGYCRFGKPGSPHPAESYHRKYAWANAPSAEAVDVYREVFAIEKEAFRVCGMPRLDGFTDPERISAFREQFFREHPELAGKRIILFAPTYRGSGQKDAHYDYGKIGQGRLCETIGKDAVVLVKMHPFIKERMPIEEPYRGQILDFSDYPNINELYMVADLLITDYSSCYYEYALLGGPVCFYTYDRLAYQVLRGVHRNVKETAPGCVCDTFEELLDALSAWEFEEEKTERFRSGLLAQMVGSAADRVIDTILSEGGYHE